MRNQNLRIGVIADDFTGASDAASYLRAGGCSTKLVIYPFMAEADITGCGAVVVALKSRSAETETAVRDSMAAAAWLLGKGAEKLYFKYCSTFDSTPRGNIGPVADMLMEMTGTGYTLLCPSLTENGRTVKDGVLYVNGVPLEESPMKHHPLNPMWDSRISVLMAQQSAYPVYILRRNEISHEQIQAQLAELQKYSSHFYLVPDYETPDDAARIASCFRDLPLWTGGSELLKSLALLRGAQAGCEKALPVPQKGHSCGRLMFCGSCSDMTQKQVARWLSSGGRGRMVTPEDAQKTGALFNEIAGAYLQDPHEDFLYYSSGSAGLMRNGPPDTAAAADIESVLSSLAVQITGSFHADRLIVAGGETSGAVIRALGLHVFSIGRSVAPGVPILYPQDTQISLVLKSGNFGGEDFFLTALKE